MFAVAACAVLSLASAAESALLAPDAVIHRAEVLSDVVKWESRIVADGAAPMGEEVVVLELPLPADVRIEDRGVAPVFDGEGRVTALKLTGFEWRHTSRPVRMMTVRITEARRVEGGELSLHPPLVAGNVVQKIVVTGADGIVFTPSPSLGIEHRIGRHESASVDWRDRHRVDDLLGDGDGRAIYVRVDDVIRRQGLHGSITTLSARRGGAVVAAGIGSITALLLMVLGYRRLRRQADLERAERIIEGEFGAL